MTEKEKEKKYKLWKRKDVLNIAVSIRPNILKTKKENKS